MRTTRVVLISAITSAVVALLAGFGGFALANDVFPDVPTSSPFHDEVSEFGGAGCADGFPDGGFHPTDPVKRQQLARFFTRCGGRVWLDEGAGSGTNLTTASIALTPPADGFIHVDAVTEITSAFVGMCPCQASTRVQMIGGGAVDSPATSTQLDEVNDGQTTSSRSQTHNVWVFPVEQGVPRTFAVVGTSPETFNLGFTTQMTAQFFPFGP